MPDSFSREQLACDYAARKECSEDINNRSHERDVAAEMGEAKTSNITVDSSAERQGRGFS